MGRGGALKFVTARPERHPGQETTRGQNVGNKNRIL